MHNRDTLIAVSGYAGDKHQIEHNLPVYAHHDCPILILSPSDAPITEVSLPGVHCQWVGGKGYIGAHTLERQRLYLEQLLTFPQDWFLFHDSDSICLSPQLPDYLYRNPTQMYANVVTDTNPGPSLLPHLVLQPPYFFHRLGIQQLLTGAKKPATSYYGSNGLPTLTKCIDHWMLQVAHSGGVPYHNFPDGASFETESQHGADTMVELVFNHKKIFLHSIKSAAVLKRLVDAHATAPV